MRFETKRCVFWFGVLFFFFFALCGNVWPDDAVRYAELGDFRLENGGVIRDCRVAYLTRGTLNAEKSNAVLVSTWLAGTSRELEQLGFIGPGKVFDTSHHFIVAVDAFANGLSSSPSNSATQKGSAFPRFGVRDLVRAQYELLNRHLNIRHVRAVAGISMGAMATFQWMVSYPDFMDLAVPIAGGPRLTSYDLLFWTAQLGILEGVGACKGGEAAMKTLAPLHVMQVWTPDYRKARTSVAAFPTFLADQQALFARFDADNWGRQVAAIMDHDILKPFGGDLRKAAAAVRARSLVITSARDPLVDREDVEAFARLIGAQTAELDGACGHFAFLCDQDRLKTMVNAFLSPEAGPPPGGR